MPSLICLLIKLLFALLLSGPALAGTDPDFITERAYFIAPTAGLTFGQVRQQTFTPYQNPLAKSYQKEGTWVRLRLDPADQAGRRLILRIGLPNYLDEVALFDPEAEPGEGEGQILQPRYSGDLYAPDPDGYNSVNLGFVIPAGAKPRDLYLRLRTVTIHYLDVGAYTPQEAYSMDRRQLLLSLLSCCFLILVLGWAILMGSQDRERVMGLFIVKQISSVVYVFLVLGLGRVFVPEWLETAWLDKLTDVSKIITVTSMIVFELAFLREFKPPRWMWKTAAWPLALSAGGIVLLAWGDTPLALQLNTAAGLLSTIQFFFLSASGRIWRDSPDQAVYILPRWSLVLYHAILLLIVILGLAPFSGFQMNYSVGIGASHIFHAHAFVTSGLILILLNARYVQREKARQSALQTMAAAQEHVREQARLQLERDFTFQQKLIDAIPGLFFLIDAQGRFLLWNKHLKTIHGISREAVAGLSLAETVVPEERQSLEGVMDKGFAEGQAAHEITLLTLTGQQRLPYFLTVYRLEWGNRTTLLGIAIDIRERKQAEEALRIAKEAAEQSLSVKSRFLAHMSHELRTPMNGIIGLSQLAREGRSVRVMEDYLDKIHYSATSLLGIINDILDFSKIEAGEMVIRSEAFQIREWVRNLLDILELKADAKGIVLRFQVEKDIPETLSGDPQRLRQVLVNLIDNAIKFTTRGEVMCHLQLASVPAGLEPDEAQVVLQCAVTDSGIGISAEGLGRLFKPFSQVDASDSRHYGGTGLGLVISNHLVTLMGGSAIAVSSTPGVGSTFSFHLPLGIARADANKTAPALPPMSTTPPLAGIRVLVVEDNRINQLVARALLERLGAITTLADDGQQAVALLTTHRHAFDVVLMDIQMPVMDGYAATTAIRQTLQLKELPIIALTAHVMASDRQHCLDVGMNAHVTKPIDTAHLVETITQLLKPGAKGIVDTSAPSQPPAEAAASESPGDRPWLDLATALEHLEGDESLYLDMAALFIQENARDIALIRQHLALQAYQDAHRIAHTLKGLAGTLGLVPLREHALALDMAMKAGQYADLESLLQPLDDELACALYGLRDMIKAKTTGFAANRV